MIPEKFIFISLALGLTGAFLYVKDIFLGQTRPNLVSWCMWIVAPFFGVYLELKAGAGLSVFPTFMAGFVPLVVVVASLIKKNGYWKVTSFDVLCGIISLLALILYIATKNLGISILFAIFSDLIAFIPTYIKSWRNPETETGAVYYLSIFANTIALLIIKDWSFTIYSFSLYLIIANTVAISILYRKNILNMLYSRNGKDD